MTVSRNATIYNPSTDTFIPNLEVLDFTKQQKITINDTVMTTDFFDGSGNYKTICQLLVPNFTITSRLLVQTITSTNITNGGNITTKSLQIDGNLQSQLIVSSNGSIDNLTSKVMTAQQVTSSSFIGNLNGTATVAMNALTANCCDYVYDKYYDGRVKEIDYRNKKDFKIRTIDETFEFVEKNRHLPTIIGREEYLKNEGTLNIGKMFEQFWETIEIQSLYIKELHERIKKLEDRVSRTSV